MFEIVCSKTVREESIQFFNKNILLLVTVRCGNCWKAEKKMRMKLYLKAFFGKLNQVQVKLWRWVFNNSLNFERKNLNKIKLFISQSPVLQKST